MATANCRNCGMEIDITSLFCTFCGAAQAVTSLPSEPVPPAAAPSLPPPVPPPPSEPIQASVPTPGVDQYGLPIYAAKANDQQGDMGRALFPRPPSLHWALVFLFTMLTFGIFGLVWYFIQSTWTKKIDSRSNATLYLILAAASWLICVPLSIYNVLANGGQPSLAASILVLLFEVVMLVFMYSAFFSMAASLRNEMPKRGVHMSIGGITLFFFTSLYLQGQLSWLARWKDTGQKDPAPPKGIFWALFAGVMVLVGAGVVLTIALIGSSLSDFSGIRKDAQAAVAQEVVPFEPSVLPETAPTQSPAQPSAEDAVAGDPISSSADAASAAADAAMMAADAAADAADVAAPVSDRAPADDSDDAAGQRARADLEQEQEGLRRERELLAEQRRQLEHEQAQAALQDERSRLVEQRRQLEQEQQQLRQQAGTDGTRRQRPVERESSADEQYENQRRECPAGFLGSECRKRIRMAVCEGHWSSSPAAGYQSCKL